MVTYDDQIDLFRLISKNLKRDVECYAFGGTAMLFYGYKDDTKDIDLVFENKDEIDEFIDVVKNLGFEWTTPTGIYIPEKLKDKNKPLMFKRGEIRFDLFSKKIFRTNISEKMKEDLFAIHEFREKYVLKIKVLRKEHLVLLKSITERQNDFDDIKNILLKEKNFDWQYLIDEAIWQHENGDDWILLDIEKTMQQLKKDFFIEEKFFEQLYKIQKNKE